MINEMDTTKEREKENSGAKFYISFDVHFISRQFKEISSFDQESRVLHRIM